MKSGWKTSNLTAYFLQNSCGMVSYPIYPIPDSKISISLKKSVQGI
jgi:hypothetical protein